MEYISIFKKKINNINLNDINELINQHVREFSLIEYKEADFLNPNRNDLQQKYWKLLRIICGFSNNLGGLLILGIKEDSNSCAESITPLYQNKSALINKLRGLTISHTTPSISLQIIDIDTNPNNLNEYILVLKLLEAPEPVMYINSSDSDSYKYFFRYNEDTIPADHATLRLLFSKKNIEEKLDNYIRKKRNYGLDLGEEINVVSWNSIPYQFPLETFTEINDSTISILRNLKTNVSRESRFHAILKNGRYSHDGILFFHQDRSLYNGFYEIKRNGYIEFKTFIKKESGFLLESYLIKDFDEFLEYLYNYYTKYDYFGYINMNLSFKKEDKTLKLGIREISGEYLHNNPNNFCPDNVIFIRKDFLIKALDTETKRSAIFRSFKKDLHACFGIP